MSSLKVFQFEAKNVRILVRENELWWVLNDVCESLDISNSRDVAQRLEDDEKDEVDIADAIGRMQSTTVVNESGLYELVFTSRKPEAKRFKRWLKRDVLPSIRKTGEYSLSQAQQQPTNKVKETIEGAKALTEYLTALGIEKTIAQSMSLDAIAQSHPELKAMCEPAKKLLSTDTAHESVGLTPTQIGKHLNPTLSAKETNGILESLGFQFKQPKRKGGKDSYVWQLTETGKQHGFVYFATNKTEWSGDQIRWQDSVVAVIQDYLSSKAA